MVLTTFVQDQCPIQKNIPFSFYPEDIPWNASALGWPSSALGKVPVLIDESRHAWSITRPPLNCQEPLESRSRMLLPIKSRAAVEAKQLEALADGQL